MPEEYKYNPDEILSDVIEQRKVSLRYFNDNFYGEWAEIYKNMKARVTPVMIKQPDGTEKEDTSRTNVCMPDHHVMVRRGVARLTRNSPNLRVRGGKDQVLRDKVSAAMMTWWDRGKANIPFRKVVHCSKSLGWGTAKNYLDKIQVTRKLKKVTAQITRQDLMKLQGAPQDEIEQMLADPQSGGQQGGAPLQEHEITAAISEYGDNVSLGVDITKYEGPVMDFVFPGDLFLEPGFKSINESAFCIENSLRDTDWLKYWVKQTTTNPFTGEETPILNKQIVQEMLDTKLGSRSVVKEREMSLRRQMREAVNITDPTKEVSFPKSPRKRFMVDERHTIENGYLVIDYIGEEAYNLGRQWYPWDTYGRYIFTDMVLIPDMIEGIGDSTPRISRFLMQLINARMNQTTDFLNNTLMPLMKQLEGEDLTDADLVRTGFGRIVQLRNMNNLMPMEDGRFPAEVWQEAGNLQRNMMQVEPATSDFSPGPTASPQAGHLATTAVLQQKAADAVLADELNQVNQFVGDTCQLWLWMSQQTMEESMEADQGAVSRVKGMSEQIEAMSLNTPGANPRTIMIDPMDIQDEYDIEPEAGSTLAGDDEFKMSAIMRGFQLAMSAPGILDPRPFAQALVEAIPGIDASAAIIPPQPPPQQKGPDVRISVAISVKWGELATDVQEAVLSGAGLPTQGTAVMGTITHAADAINKIRGAADDATELHRPVDHNPGGAAGDTGQPARKIGTPGGSPQDVGN